MTLVTPRIVNNASCVKRSAVFGEIWNDSRSAKCCIFQYKMLVVGVKSNLGREAGCGLTVSWSDHARIGRALEMTFQLFSANFF